MEQMSRSAGGLSRAVGLFNVVEARSAIRLVPSWGQNSPLTTQGDAVPAGRGPADGSDWAPAVRGPPDHCLSSGQAAFSRRLVVPRTTSRLGSTPESGGSGPASNDPSNPGQT